MTWHLKDRELEHKLIEIDADFSENLNRTCESLDTNKDGDFCNYQQVRVNLRHDSKLFTVVFLGSDVESVHNYNAGGWNHWPETKPEECVLMEIRKDGKDETHGFLFFLGNTWYHAMGLPSRAVSTGGQRMSEAKIHRIFNFYGEQSQLAKTQEELKELDEAIQKVIDLYKQASFYRSEQDSLKDHIAEEAADVSIMIDQLKYGLGISARFEAWREYKIDRQLRRMEAEIK